MGKWKPMETAEYNLVVEVEVEGGQRFLAVLLPDAGMTEDEEYCDQWEAATDKFPDCWHDGCCWASNADGIRSLQPTRWRLPQPPAEAVRQARGGDAPTEFKGFA